MTEFFEVKSLEEMPKALNFLIKKVDNLQETVNTLRHKQQASESPRWMNIDELCAYHPSHPKKQTVYEWVSFSSSLYPISIYRSLDSQTHEAHLRLEVLLQYAKPKPSHAYVALPHVRKLQSQYISALRSYSLFFCLDISLLVISFVVQVDAV